VIDEPFDLEADWHRSPPSGARLKVQIIISQLARDIRYRYTSRSIYSPIPKLAAAILTVRSLARIMKRCYVYAEGVSNPLCGDSHASRGLLMIVKNLYE
jgi:hypothetical protein